MRRLEEAADLLGAKSLDEVGRVLFGGARDRSQPWIAAASFRGVHKAHPEEAGDCALLLCTDRRWSRMTVHLVREILGNGLLADEERERLADLFLWRDRLVVDVPVQWLDNTQARATSSKRRSTVPAVRKIEPPLRRWAVAQMLTKGPEALDPILERARALRGPAAAAVVAGMLDATGALPDTSIEVALEVGLRWPLGNVRMAALSILAQRGGETAALEQAAQDPDARVRRWRPRVMRVAGDAHEAPTGTPQNTAQMVLFEEPRDTAMREASRVDVLTEAGATSAPLRNEVQTG